MKSTKFGLIAAMVASIYLLIPYAAGRQCLGMECLNYMAATLPVAAIGLPWSLAAAKIPDTSDTKSKGIYRGAALQRGYWLRMLGFVAAYLANIFIVFSTVHFVVKKYRGRPQ